ncbi:hypothetical protein ACFV0L_27410 [Streptosporangium canum]|uniref:hypothetical protein n=1 Tax=Streptosporangium canum TaxID=324952 RepID=UPI003686FE20
MKDTEQTDAFYLEVSFVCPNRNFDQASPLHEWASLVCAAMQCGDSKIRFSPQGEPIDSSQEHGGRRIGDGLRNTGVAGSGSGRGKQDHQTDRDRSPGPADGWGRRPSPGLRTSSLEFLSVLV